MVVPHQGIEVIVQHSEMIIRGTEDLVDAVSRALLLLDNVPEHRTEVDEHMRLITASPLSYSYALLPGMEFYICQRDLEEGHVWCAGQICHDAMHMHLFDAFLRKKERLFTSEEE
ncbi:MAG: hypothetical protein KJ574_00520, partial [Nanoarchaeota archaeon]|nr:hypothetical protein [Nanoarchaeota archaeon]